MQRINGNLVPTFASAGSVKETRTNASSFTVLKLITFTDMSFPAISVVINWKSSHAFLYLTFLTRKSSELIRQAKKTGTYDYHFTITVGPRRMSECLNSSNTKQLVITIDDILHEKTYPVTPNTNPKLETCMC